MSQQSPIDGKLKRIQSGDPPNLVDLFAGCGGLTLGFHRAGVRPIVGVEQDPYAARSHATNFHGHLNSKSFELHAQARDITKTDPMTLLRELGYRAPETAVDIIVGGPPCPAFTRVGRAKLREVYDHPEAFKHDPRAQLYVPYLNFVRALRPLAILMENVPDVLNFGGTNLAEEICETLEALDYRCAYTLLNAANYGVPQMRERFFLVAYHQAVGAAPSFPSPSHHIEFPLGYKGSRAVALKHVHQPEFGDAKPRFVSTPIVDPASPKAVSVEEAIADLPPITEHLNGGMKRGARRFDQPVGYGANEPSTYARLMREWPEFTSDGKLFDHVTRSLSQRDFRLFESMEPGDDYPKAHELATRLFEARLEALRQEGRRPDPGSVEYLKLKADYIPPYDPHKFPNKWRKMEPSMPARTLMAHLGKDSYTHIHFDSSQQRVLSVREAARLQSFPDGFKFCGTMNPAFRQIGNAVPPLLAAALAQKIVSALTYESAAK